MKLNFYEAIIVLAMIDDRRSKSNPFLVSISINYTKFIFDVI